MSRLLPSLLRMKVLVKKTLLLQYKAAAVSLLLTISLRHRTTRMAARYVACPRWRRPLPCTCRCSLTPWSLPSTRLSPSRHRTCPLSYTPRTATLALVRPKRVVSLPHPLSCCQSPPVRPSGRLPWPLLVPVFTCPSALFAHLFLFSGCPLSVEQPGPVARCLPTRQPPPAPLQPQRHRLRL